jgi:hypothetical protein
MANDENHDDRVGYARPPRLTQFKKGQSGNPRGRGKGSKNLPTLIIKSLNESVTVNENGQRKIITKFEAMTKQLVNKAASGDPKATQSLLQLIQVIEGRSETQIQDNAVDGADRQVMEGIFSRLRRAMNEGPDETSNTG